jgi:acyl carrier protein
MHLEKEVIKEKVKTYIIQSAYSGEAVIQDNSLIFQEGYFDSMGFVRLITFLDDELGIQVMNDELIEENFESINAIVDFIARKAK